MSWLVLWQPSRTFSTTSAWHTINSLHTFSEEEDLLRESVKRFAQEVVGPKVREMDENEMMDPSVIKGLFEQGLAKVDPSVSVLCDVHNTLVNTVIRKYGAPRQQERWLPQLADFCLSEPASGSDKDGDNWIVSGSKMWITNSYEAEVFLVFANIDPSLDYKGITCFCFLVTKDMGVQIAKREQKLVPAENVIGGERLGYKIAIEILNEDCLAQGAFDKAVPYSYERKQFGQPVGTFQDIAFQIAQAAIELESARLLAYNAARRKEEGRSFTKEAAMVKYWASVVAQRVSGEAIEWTGGKYWRDSKIGAIYEGTSDIQLQTIFKFIQKGILRRIAWTLPQY
ncbi:Acyl-CoA dehydrogenase/oxidase, N-terminal and middle domain containing protein [Russula decolorans]